jgi:hypothetical protein
VKKLKEFFENIAYAGLKPSGQKAAPRPDTAWGRMRTKVDEFLAGGPAPSDPLYLTNRSLAQKAKPLIIIGVPLLVLLGAIGVSLSNILDPPEAKPTVEPTAKEVASKILPNLDSNLKIENSTDVEVVEVKVEHTGGSKLVGSVRNNTNHEIPVAHMVVDLTDTSGSQVGGVEVVLEAIPASKTKTFSQPIAQHTAAFALVREVAPGR